MKKVYQNSDITFIVDDDRGIKERFIIRFYTVNKTLFTQKTAENVIIEKGKRTIKLNWAELVLIGDGVLNYAVNNLTEDEDFDDHIFNQTFSRSTDYYIASNVIVDEEAEESIAETIGDLISGIRADLSEEKTARQQADSALQTGLNETVTVLQGEITSRQREQQFLSQQISNEATQRQQADEDLESGLIALSNTMADKEKVMAYVVSDIYNTLQIFECGDY